MGPYGIVVWVQWVQGLCGSYGSVGWCESSGSLEWCGFNESSLASGMADGANGANDFSSPAQQTERN